MEVKWQQVLQRRKDVNKYDLGHVLVIGGSDGMEGAPMLVAEASMRVGAGLATIASTADVLNRIAGDIREVMTRAIISDDAEESCWEIQEFIEQHTVRAVVIGSGMSKDTHELISRLLHKITIPTVIDAEALRALSGQQDFIQQIAQRNKQLVFTPHTGEFADLLQEDTVSPRDAELFATRYKATAILKGNPSFVATPQELHEGQTSTPALATAGTGDVLAGVVAGFMTQGIGASEAAVMAVHVHGVAGRIAAQRLTEAGVIATDVIGALPQALVQVADQESKT